MSGPETEHDYVVVGAGSAGSAVASRLSESGANGVLLLEAGEDDPWIWFKVPLGAGYILLTQRGMWRFRTEPEARMGNRQMYWPRGRILGGSSTVNGMLWVRGEPAEYDNWAALGNGGWAYEDVLPFLKKIERYADGDPEFRGTHGPIHIDRFPGDKLDNAFLAACVEAGIPANADYNGARYEGVGHLQSNTKHGMRFGAREAYLGPARGRSTLEIRTNARASRIRIENGRAAGVEYDLGGNVAFARAKHEVIVSAGAIQSPQLLELSGIGNPEILSRFGIAPLVDLPGVGENLRDHLHTRVSYECREPITLNDMLNNPLRKMLMGLRYLLFRRGPMSACTAMVHALAKSEPSLDRPDVKIQLHNVSADDPRHPTEFRVDPFPGFGIGTFMLRPESRGSVHIRSADPAEPPAIVANYLADERDRRASIAALRLARRVAEQPALQDLIVREVRPGPEAQSDDALLDHIAKQGATSYHPIGTCRMGLDRMAVVDPELRVHGVKALRVADASVMPTMVSSNTNAPSFMIGERCAAFAIRDQRRNS
jgi:choline dehydrogenase